MVGAEISDPEEQEEAAAMHPSEFSFHDPLAPTSTASTELFDLSPADDIFFHGHLLPLHLHRSSSTDSTFTLALSKDESSYDDQRKNIDDNIGQHQKNSEGKSRSFSHLFPKRRKDQERDDEHNPKLWKSKFDIVKKLVKPFSINPFRHKRAGNNNNNNDTKSNEAPDHKFLRQPEPFNDYSGSLRVRKKKDFVVKGRRSEFASAPVSKITSPANSGPLVATRNLTHKSDSAVEELQAAIQAAIAHCKKSVNAN